MATYATLTIPVADIVGAQFNASRASVWIEPNVPVVLADSIRLGGRREQVVNGVATFTNLVTTNSADNPASFGYRVTITAPPKGAQRREDIVVLTTSDFPFTATANLKDIDEAWDNVTAPPEWRSEFRAEMEAIRDGAAAIVGPVDATVEALVKNTGGVGPLTSAALGATIAAEVPDASTATKGRVRLATLSEVATGTATDRAVTPAGLLASYVPRGALGVPTIVKPLGNGYPGYLDWSNDDATGYTMHLRLGPNSGAGAAAVGIGTDEGAGNGLLVSHKNGAIGVVVAGNPSSTGVAVDIRGYSQSANGFVYHAHANTPGMLIESATGAAFKDGVATNGSTTFTSATAAFVAGDVGKSLSQLTSTPTTPAVIPAGATIVSVTNATTVVLSAAATGSATNVQFLIAGRVPSSGSQPLTIRPAIANQKAMAIRKATDAFDTVQVYENGAINFGAGTVATDVNLYRATNGRLGTDSQFQAVQGVATRVIAGAGKTTVTDGDFSRTPPDGMTVWVHNTTDGTARQAVRIAGSWKYGAVVS